MWVVVGDTRNPGLLGPPDAIKRPERKQLAMKINETYLAMKIVHYLRAMWASRQDVVVVCGQKRRCTATRSLYGFTVRRDRANEIDTRVASPARLWHSEVLEIIGISSSVV